MSSRSVPSVSGRWPRSMLTDSGRDVSDLGTPLVSPLTPLPAEVLDRARKGTFGPEDPHPKEGTVIRRVQAATDELWVKHRKGVDLIARPGSIVSPQTLYTGKERRGNGQDVYHAILLNARLLIHNPDTGEPGAINGHAGIQFYAAPVNNRAWGMEVPYASDAQLDLALAKYGIGVHREVDQDSSNESSVSEGWRPKPAIESPVPRRAELGEQAVLDVADFFCSELGCTEDTEQRIADEAALYAPEEVGESTRLPWAIRLGPVSLPTTWTPAEDAWTPSNPKPLERWEHADGHIERVHYSPRTCNWVRPPNADLLPKLVFSSFNATETDEPTSPQALVAIGNNDDSISSSSSEEEEGEIDDHALPHDPRLRSQADEIPLPVLGSLRRGALITRDKYSSSPSVAPSESTADCSVYDRSLDANDLATSANRLAEAERIISAAIHSEFFDLPPATSSSPDPLFQFDPDSDSLPELVDASSSESTGSSDLDRLDLDGMVEVCSVDCIDAINHIRQIAPSSDLDPHQRSSAQFQLLAWGRQQEEIKERLRNGENNQALFPLRQALDMMNRLLDGLVDRAEMTDHRGDGNCGGGAKESDNATTIMNAEQTLDLVAPRSGEGKRKIRDESVVAITRDGKRLRRMNGEAWGRGIAWRVALQAEVARLRVYLGPLVDLRFRDARVIAHLLHSDILSLDDVLPLDNDVGPQQNDELSAAQIFERACFNHKYSEPVSNVFLRQTTPPGIHVPGPLFRTLPVPAWLTSTSRGQTSRPASPAERMFRRNESSGAVAPFQIYDTFGNYSVRPARRSPIPIHAAPRRYD
ncbi:hypothetical protein B0H13DRAFT_1858708 [Mycena leptocephala]|nr:hypothetical protein B0H13DRAFT_1858708 [Mycena leptocephala]